MSNEIESTPPPAGWYAHPDDAALNRWWDGARWTEHSTPAAPALGARPIVYVSAPAAAKTSGVAYLFFWLLGGFSAHNFYLGRIGPGIGFLALYWGGWALTAVGVGYLLLAAAIVWWIVDLACMGRYLDAANARGWN